MSPKTRDSVFEMLQKLVCFHFEPQDADIGAQIRATLAQTGRPIGPYDLLLAATALRHGLTLVTSNEKEFSRIPDLKWENWRLMV